MKQNSMISLKTVLEVRNRHNFKCNHCGKPLLFQSTNIEKQWQLNHSYRKSEYNKDDRDEAWNLSLLCVEHHVWKTGVHNGNKEIDAECKALADQLKPPHLRSTKKAKIPKKDIQKRVVSEKEKEQARYFAKKRRTEEIDRYKKMNNWLTPSQVQYRKNKAYRAEQKKSKNPLQKG